MSVKILVDNDKELDIIQPLNFSGDEENLVWNCSITIAPIGFNDEKRYIVDYITNPTTRRKAVISVWIDGKLYFTGFWSSGEPVIIRENITCTIKLESKTVDIRDSTYIPPAYDKVNGISQFSTDGKLTYIDIIKLSLASLSWNVVDPFGDDGERRLSDYKSIAIIDKSKTASTKISVDKKTNETTETNIVIEEGEAFDSNKLSADRKTLAPRVTEKVGAFLTSLGNELGKMLTTNEYGDLVITNAAEVEIDIDPVKRFVYIPGDQRNNILQLSFSSNDSGIYHKYIRLDQSGKLSLKKPKEILTIEQGVAETGQRKGVSFSQTMIPSINDNARETRVLTYVNNETVEVQQQLANQEMYAKTAEARATNFKIQTLSLYYEGSVDEVMPSYGTPIRPGDFVYIYIYNPLSDEIYDGEIRYVSQVDISLSRDDINVSVELKLPKFFSNPSVRPRRVTKPRALSSF